MKIIALTDYKNRFGSKHFDVPYRSGMDKKLLQESFQKGGYDIEYIQFTELVNRTNIPKDCYYIYTSSEDQNYLYKNFIEDQILFLQESGCKVVPEYKYLRANNNKVFMELLRKSTGDFQLQTISSFVFGTKEEAMAMIDCFTFPVVIKKSEGASGRGVFKADNKIEFEKIVNKIAASKNCRHDLKEIGRAYKHSGYLKESRYRYKFVVQNMVPGLENDWKIYYFMDKLFVFYRPVFKSRGFRASGGGYDNYFYGESSKIPDGLFAFVEEVVKNFDVPHASMDIAYDGEKFHLIEIQFLYFGTAGIPYSKGYFKKIDGNYKFMQEDLTIEETYARAITKYIDKQL